MGEELSVLVQLVLEAWAALRSSASQRHRTPSVLRQMALAGLEARGIQEVVGCTMTNRGVRVWRGEGGLGNAMEDTDMDILVWQVVV